MYNAPIRNNKLLQEAYQRGYHQALNEDIPSEGWDTLCALVNVCNQDDYDAWIAGCPPCAEYGAAFWAQWFIDQTIAPGHKGLPQCCPDEGEDTFTFTRRTKGRQGRRPLPAPTAGQNAGQNDIYTDESYQRGYRAGLNEASGGGFGGGGGKHPIQPELYSNPNTEPGGTPDPWYVGWLESYGMIWWNLMQQGPDADWSQLPGMVSGGNGWIFQTPGGNFNITWSFPPGWVGFDAVPDMAWPE